MRSSLITTFTGLAIFLSTISCRTRSDENPSQMKHIAGQLSRPNLIKLTPNTCYYDKIASSKGSAEVNKYLQQIFDRITSANRDIFTGDYAPQNFCISNSPDDYINAFASPHGRIMFTDKIVKSAPNDAAIAFVLAHESAHILMQHSALKVLSGNLDYIDHPWLAENRDWKNFLANRPAESPENEKKLANARTALSDATKKRAEFLAPIRKFLNPATNDLENRLRATLNNLDKKTAGINSNVEKMTLELENFKKTPDYQAMSADQKKALDEYYGARIKTVLDYSPMISFAIAAARKQLDGIDGMINDELSRALSANLGGILGSQWKKINSAYEQSKTVVKQLEGDQDFNAKIIMDKASQLIGYDYNRYNWMEAEADQVGLELLLRAGFTPDGSQDLFKILLEEVATLSSDGDKKKKETVETCLKNLEDLKAGKQVGLPERGNKTHPESCWRLINTGYTELKLHESHYAPFVQKAVMTEAVPGALARIKTLP